MPKDILFTDDLQSLIQDGDFVIGESTYQHQRCLLLADKGEFKQFPKVGVGSKRFLESQNPNDFAREVRQEFTSDGMVVNQIKIEDNLEINIDAQYYG